MNNAEWCIKNGIKFKKLKCEWYSNSSHDSVGCYDSDGIYHEFYKGKALGDDMTESILAWLDMEHVEPILDDAEKRYLSAVIRPFRDRVVFVKKIRYTGNYEQIIMRVKSIATDTDIAGIPFPFFEKGKMYKGMNPNREYTLEELGL